MPRTCNSKPLFTPRLSAKFTCFSYPHPTRQFSPIYLTIICRDDPLLLRRVLMASNTMSIKGGWIGVERGLVTPSFKVSIPKFLRRFRLQFAANIRVLCLKTRRWLAGHSTFLSLGCLGLADGYHEIPATSTCLQECACAFDPPPPATSCAPRSTEKKRVCHMPGCFGLCIRVMKSVSCISTFTLFTIFCMPFHGNFDVHFRLLFVWQLASQLGVHQTFIYSTGHVYSFLPVNVLELNPQFISHFLGIHKLKSLLQHCGCRTQIYIHPRDIYSHAGSTL